MQNNHWLSAEKLFGDSNKVKKQKEIIKRILKL